MAAGQFSLFDDIFIKKKPLEEKEPLTRNCHRPKRNEHLILRYYYYAEMKYLRYDKCLEYLAKEFYITERTILDILFECSDQLREVADQKPSLKELQHQVPHFAW